MSTVAIIQARMGSTRLPGKVLERIGGKPLLEYVVRRTQRAETVTKVVVATSTEPRDGVIERCCGEVGVDCFRGDEGDVLDRYYRAAVAYGAESVVRVTADCPLICPEVIDRVVRVYRGGDYDYVSNTAPRTYPDGLDTEVMSIGALSRAWEEAKRPWQREHVTPYIRENPGVFRMQNVRNEVDLSSWRWTVDEARDLELVRAVYARVGNDGAGMAELVRVVESDRGLRLINAGIQRTEGRRVSLEKDQRA
jgi:spore coat polysaccharide biosynthesis protein SpsF (cytidylyltransferase family)